MKLPWTSLTFRVTPRLMVCLRLHAVSTPLVDVDSIEPVLPTGCGASYTEGSEGLEKGEEGSTFSQHLVDKGKGRSPTHAGG